MTPEDGRSAYSFGEIIVALFGALLIAAVTFALVFVGSIPLGNVLGHMGLLTDEGAAWFGISLGVPCGIVCSLLSFFYSFRKILRGRWTR